MAPLAKGNDQVRFELTYTALDPRLKVIAMARVGDPFATKTPSPSQGSHVPVKPR